MNFDTLQQIITSWLTVFAADPLVQILQISMVAIAIVMVCIVFFTTRDVLLRSDSFVFMLFAILLVTVLPVAGFILYLLIRPARTVAERRIEWQLQELMTVVHALEKKLDAAKKTSKPTKKPVKTRKKIIRAKK